MGALLSIVAGESTMLYLTFSAKSAPFGLSSGLWGLLVALFAFVAISFMAPPLKRTVDIVSSIEEFFGYGKAEP